MLSIANTGGLTIAVDPSPAVLALAQFPFRPGISLISVCQSSTHYTDQRTNDLR
jgi:hypothetical protein